MIFHNILLHLSHLLLLIQKQHSFVLTLHTTMIRLQLQNFQVIWMQFVNTVLTNYNTGTLQTFNSQYRASEVQRLIDESDTAILNNTTSVKLSKFFTPTQGSTTSYYIPFNNSLLHPEDGYLDASGGIVTSSGFKVGTDTTTEFFFDDDGEGNLRRYALVGTTRSYFDSQAGTIDYTSGAIRINNINITTVSNVDGATSEQIRLVVSLNHK